MNRVPLALLTVWSLNHGYGAVSDQPTVDDAGPMYCTTETQFYQAPPIKDIRKLILW